jgi:transposase
MCHPVTPSRPVPASALTLEGDTSRMTMLAEIIDAVIGIDTHRDSHEVEIADPAGRPITVLRIGNDSAGFAQLLAAITEVAPGPRVAVCIEGTRSYGVGLARALAAAGLLVLECEQPARKQRRGKGKSDPVDAHLAVLAALRLDTGRLPVPRADGDREALRILLVARQEITVACTAQAGRLRALLLAGDDTDRRAARTALPGKALAALADRELAAHASREQAVRQAEIRRLALALSQARQQLTDNRAQLLAIVEDIAPGLTSRFGVGPVSAAQAIVSFSHPGRCRSQAAYAALGGTSPIPASSGQTVRHRLNRGGDRALNRAIHSIALVRMRSCPRTRAYVARRTAEGKTTREIRRCLKRYIARELYRQLTRSMNLPVGP